MKNILEKLSKIGIPLLIVIIIILGVIFILTRQGMMQTGSESDQLQNDIDEIIAIENENLVPLDVRNNTEIKIADKTITFKDSFLVNSAAQATRVSGIECRSPNTGACIFNFLTDGNSTFYITTPSEPIAFDGFDKSNDTTQILNTPYGDVFLNYRFLTVYPENPEDEIDVTLIRQVYGCVQTNICVGSGLLNIDDPDVNASQVAEFEDFVKSLNIN